MDNGDKNAIFLQRAVAFFIDAIILTFCVSMIAGFFVNTTAIDKINTQLQDLIINLENSEISYVSYVKEVAVLGLQSQKLNGMTTLITILFEILYFVVYPIYNSGQTIGKKLLNIKIVSKNGELTMNQMIGRGLLVNSILLNMILITVVTFVNDPMHYLYINGSFELLQYMFYFITILMVMFRKDHVSLHDVITNTRVIKL